NPADHETASGARVERDGDEKAVSLAVMETSPARTPAEGSTPPPTPPKAGHLRPTFGQAAHSPAPRARSSRALSPQRHSPVRASPLPGASARQLRPRATLDDALALEPVEGPLHGRRAQA